MLTYRSVKPNEKLSDFVDSFWMLHNDSANEKEVIVLPDGRIDLFLTKADAVPFHLLMLGLGTQPERSILPAGKLIFAISFKLLATEYILQNSVSDIVNNAISLPVDFWNFVEADLCDFDAFCQTATQKIALLLPDKMDNRKQQLFELIYTSNGAWTVQELSEKVYWSSRQINRYFNQQYGLSLKAYCNILRFRASFQQIKDSRLFPEQNFADQSHFIKEIKKLSGVSPKDLSRNLNGRFIQFSTLGQM